MYIDEIEICLGGVCHFTFDGSMIPLNSKMVASHV